MSEDANQSEEVSLPTTTSGAGIEAHMEAAESSTASEDQHESKSNGVQDRINDLTAKRYQAERERDELRQKLEAAQNQPNTAAPQSVEASSSAPQLPDDMYDEDAMRKYHGDMVAHSDAVAKQQAKAFYDQQQDDVKRKSKEAEVQATVNTFAQNAVRDGVDLEKLRGAEQALLSANISPELGQYLLADANGGKIVTHLANNPALMHELISMPPMAAAVKIATEVKQQALSQTPSVTQTPQPIADVRGGGVDVKDIFDRTYAGYEIL